MKYNININQKSIIELGLKLDVVDLAIFDFIKDFANTSSCLKVTVDGKQYFWISHSKVIQELPIIRISTRQGIFKRINKLIDADLIGRIDVDNQKSYYCFGKNYDNVIFVADGKQSFTPPVNESLHLPVNDCLHNYNTINNNTNNKKEKPALLFFKDSKWSDYDTLKSYLSKDKDFVSKYSYTDLKHYIAKADTWSENKQQKRTDRGWIMTIRDWISEAELSGTRVKIEKPKANNEGNLFFNQ